MLLPPQGYPSTVVAEYEPGTPGIHGGGLVPPYGQVVLSVGGVEIGRTELTSPLPDPDPARPEQSAARFAVIEAAASRWFLRRRPR
jgi:hypothetical protein